MALADEDAGHRALGQLLLGQHGVEHPALAELDDAARVTPSTDRTVRGNSSLRHLVPLKKP